MTKSLKKANQPTFIDLFSGIGGFRIGMEEAGFKHLFSNDYDKYANMTYRAWYGSERHLEASLWDVDIKNEIPQHDVLCGGFPCQPFSNAGKKLGFKDEAQGNLFFRIKEIIEQKRPKIVFLENVRTLLTHDNGNTFETINLIMNQLGYIGEKEIINSKFWVPQNRHRVFLIYLDNSQFGLEQLDYVKQNLSLIAGGLGNSEQQFISIKEENPSKEYEIPQGTWESLQRHKARHDSEGRGFGYQRIADFSKQTRTLSARYAKDGAEILIKERYWRRPRKLTLTEAKLLMGFNDYYAKNYGHKKGFPIDICSKAQSYKQFGNSVVPKIVEEIANILIKLF